MCAETPDYKDTLNLPKTEFPMRAGLPRREPDWLTKWEDIKVYDTLRQRRVEPHLYCMMDLHMRTVICILVMHLIKS